MKLYENLPDSVTCKGTCYRLDLSFRTVLAAFDALEDDKLSDTQQISAALDLLVIGKHPKDPELLREISKIVSTEKSKPQKERVIDLHQDWAYIYAGFMQAYGVDLFNAQLHWLQFQSMLRSLPRSTRMAEIIDIRARPLPKPTKHNAEERAQLLRLKTEYALQPKNGLQNGLKSMFEALKAQAKARG